MKPSRFTEEQIIRIVREREAGAATADVCRKHGISSATFYKWKAKYGGVGRQTAEGAGRRERQTEEVVGRGDAGRENAMLKDVAAKKW